MHVKTNNRFECGKRIKTARLLAGLSRKDMQEKFYISTSTLQAWEIGKNPLNEKNAKKLIGIFNSMKLLCSAEWLLYGIGTPPKTFSELQQIRTAQKKIEIVTWEDQISIQKEISFFSSVNSDAIVVVVNDNGMEPFYTLGDYVGGKKRFSKHIHSAVGMHCIVQLEDESIYIRQVKNCSRIGAYNLFCINPNSNVLEPVLFEVKIIFAAPIIWHRKNEP